MADDSLKQVMQDAILDADSLERFVNGSEVETVLTRLSAEYPTIKNMVAKIKGDATADYQAIFNQLMTENNIAGRFYTLSALQASDLQDGQYALVADDDNDKSGVYIKEDGVWRKSKYSTDVMVKSIAKEYLDRQNFLIKETSITSDKLFAFADANNNVVEYTAVNGDKFLTGVDGSVQSILNGSKNASDIVRKTIDDKLSMQNTSIAIADNANNIQAYLTNDSHLHLTYLEQSVQDEIRDLRLLSKEIIKTSGVTEVAGAIERTKGNYSVDALDLLRMKVPQDTYETLVIDTPYGKDDDIIHPDVITLAEPMRGYKYMMCLTPYANYNSDLENPVIYGSNDKKNWEMLSFIDQPLEEPPQFKNPSSGIQGYLSDNWLSYDPINKELLCCYRRNIYANGKNAGYSSDDTTELVYRKTVNGLHWSDPVQLTPKVKMSEDDYISPNMIYDTVNNRWVLIYSGFVRFNDTLNPETWTAKQSIGLKEYAASQGRSAWHFGTGFVGDKLIMVHGDTQVTGAYYIAVSTDDSFLSWQFTSIRLIDKWIGAYKASFLVEHDESKKTVELQFYITKGGPSKLYTAKTLPIPTK